MKLVTFEANGNSAAASLVGRRRHRSRHRLRLARARPGARVGRRPHLHDRYGAGILGFVEHASDARPAADEIVQRFEAKTHAGRRSTAAPSRTRSATSRSLRPIPRPPSMRDGYAFRQHVETARKNRGLEMIPEFDQFPVFYFTNHQAVIGPGELRVQKLHLDRLDFELEAAIVVGKRGRNVSAPRARTSSSSASRS